LVEKAESMTICAAFLITPTSMRRWVEGFLPLADDAAKNRLRFAVAPV